MLNNLVLWDGSAWRCFGRSRTYGVSKAHKDKASRPVLDAEEVTILLNSNTKA